MSDQEVSDAVYMIAGLADCCDDGKIRGVDVLEQHEREEMGAAIRTVTAALAAVTSERDSLLAALKVADDALCEYACRSPDEPFLACMRSDDQCNQDCGRAAFDALCAVRAAALTTKEG